MLPREDETNATKMKPRTPPIESPPGEMEGARQW